LLQLLSKISEILFLCLSSVLGEFLFLVCGLVWVDGWVLLLCTGSGRRFWNRAARWVGYSFEQTCGYKILEQFRFELKKIVIKKMFGANFGVS
jgi:hypothetical protein